MTILRLYNLFFFLIQVFCLIEAVEIVVRRHLNVGNVHNLGGDFDYKEVILSEALGSKKVLDLWDIITQTCH